MADDVFRDLDFKAGPIDTPDRRVLFIRDTADRSKEKLSRVVTFSGLHNPDKMAEIQARDAAIVKRFDPKSTDAPVVYASTVKTNQAGQSFYVNIVGWQNDSGGRFVGGAFHTQTRRFAVQGTHGDSSGFKEIVFGEGLKHAGHDAVDWGSIHTTRCAENSETPGLRVVAKRHPLSDEWVAQAAETFAHSSHPTTQAIPKLA